jgi:hypothetical protein
MPKPEDARGRQPVRTWWARVAEWLAEGAEECAAPTPCPGDLIGLPFATRSPPMAAERAAQEVRQAKGPWTAPGSDTADV